MSDQSYTKDEFLKSVQNLSLSTADQILSEEFKEEVLKVMTENAASDINSGMPAEVVLWSKLKDALVIGILMGENRFNP